MKPIRTNCWMTICMAIMVATLSCYAPADESKPGASRDRHNHYTGTVVSVEPNEHNLALKGFVSSRRFNLGNACEFALLDKDSGTAGDLRPGEKVTVSYQNVQGVLIADRVEQQPMRLDGMVTAIHPATHTMTVRVHMLDKTLHLPADCKVVLRDEKYGALADIQTGDHVTVTYEKPAGGLSARMIAQTSQKFTGTLTAIDLRERTVKASSFLNSKKFNLADNCAIVLDGKPNGKLASLKPNDRLVFNYDEINGVNVANRIAPAGAESQASPEATNSIATSAPMTGY